MLRCARNDRFGEIAPLARTGWLREGVVFGEGVVNCNGMDDFDGVMAQMAHG